MNTPLLTVLFILITQVISAQTAFQNLGSEIVLRINSNGTMGINPDDLTYHGKQINSGYNYLNQVGLWITADDNFGNQYSSIQHIKSIDSADFWPGPLDTFTGQSGDKNYWNTVWKISKNQIDHHLNNYSKSNYTIDSAILKWPGNGIGSFNQYLAPFLDANNNNVYDPLNGDAPHIKGDNAVYCIFNDFADEHTSSFGPEIGLEVHMLAYSYNNTSAIYFDYFIINRQATDYKNVKVGLFLDAACGSETNNFGRSYPNLNAFYVYSSDLDAEFGDLKPFVSIQFLNQKLTKSIFFSEENDYDQKPNGLNDYTNYLSGKWLDSSLLTFKNTGHQGNELTDHMFVYHSDNNQNWTEESAGNAAGKRNAVGSTIFTNLNSQDHIHFVACLDAGVAKNPELIHDEVEDKLESNLSQFQQTNGVKDNRDNQSIIVYPNPASSNLYVKSLNGLISHVELINCQGKVVNDYNNINSRILMQRLQVEDGLYVIRVTANNQTTLKRIVITNK